MPSNINQLKSAIRRRVKRADTVGQVTQVVVSSVARNLARFTNVDEGILAGGWTVIVKSGQKPPTLRPGGLKKDLPINKTRQISLKNGQRIDSIKGGQSVVIGNNIFYGQFVNDGTRTQRPSRFMQRGVRTSQAELNGLGIKTEVSSG